MDVSKLVAKTQSCEARHGRKVIIKFYFPIIGKPYRRFGWASDALRCAFYGKVQWWIGRLSDILRWSRTNYVVLIVSSSVKNNSSLHRLALRLRVLHHFKGMLQPSQHTPRPPPLCSVAMVDLMSPSPRSEDNYSHPTLTRWKARWPRWWILWLYFHPQPVWPLLLRDKVSIKAPWKTSNPSKNTSAINAISGVTAWAAKGKQCRVPHVFVIGWKNVME